MLLSINLAILLGKHRELKLIYQIIIDKSRYYLYFCSKMIIFNIQEEFESMNPSASRQNKISSLDRANSKEDSFGPYKNCLVQNLNNCETIISPSTEHLRGKGMENQNINSNNPPFLSNFALSNKRGGKKKFARCNKTIDKNEYMNNVTDSIECPQTSDYHLNNREQFSSLRRANAYQMSAMRPRTDDDYEVHNSGLFKSVQYCDPGQSIDSSQLSSGYSLHFRKLVGKLQKQMEDELINKTRKIEIMLDKKLSSLIQDSDMCSNSMTKNEIK